MVERNYKYIAMTYIKVLQLQQKVNELSSALMLLGSYPSNYQKSIDDINMSLNTLLERLEFQYK